jgi:hypothetical protein
MGGPPVAGVNLSGFRERGPGFTQRLRATRSSACYSMESTRGTVVDLSLGSPRNGRGLAVVHAVRATRRFFERDAGRGLISSAWIRSRRTWNTLR